MEERLLNWEDGVYRLAFDLKGAGGASVPVAVFKVDGDNETPVDGRLWATILFEGRTQPPAGLTDDELRLKAAGVTFAILTIADDITKTLQKEVTALNRLNEKTRNAVFVVVACAALLQAQKLFSERVISDEENATRFAYHLFRMFEKVSGVDPRSHMREVIEYVQQGEPSRELQYIGSKLCQIVDKRDAV